MVEDPDSKYHIQRAFEKRKGVLGDRCERVTEMPQTICNVSFNDRLLKTEDLRCLLLALRDIDFQRSFS